MTDVTISVPNDGTANELRDLLKEGHERIGELIGSAFDDNESGGIRVDTVLLSYLVVYTASMFSVAASGMVKSVGRLKAMKGADPAIDRAIEHMSSGGKWDISDLLFAAKLAMSSTDGCSQYAHDAAMREEGGQKATA